MRSIFLAAMLLLGGAAATFAQDEAYRGDAGATYQWVRTNAAPGDCGCFSLNGFGISGSWDVHGPWSLVTDFGADFRAAVPSGQGSLTVLSFVAGARYRIPQPWFKGEHRPLPFAQALIGIANASGTESGVADRTDAFAARIGGGIDVPLKSHFVLRAFQAEWYRTQFANNVNDHQNNLQISAGLFYRWSHSK
jgi:peptidoglycan-associated lipoprotein